MPKNYYCDFCQCTFPDNKTNRKNHNEGATHVNNRQLHYDWFKDPSVFLQEQINKPPCRYYRHQGYCEFGLLCKYSHITYDSSTGQLVYPPELIQWFQLQKEETTANNALQSNTTRTNIPRRYKLPAGWKVKDLPPSLKPPPSKHGYNWDINTVGTWSL